MTDRPSLTANDEGESLTTMFMIDAGGNIRKIKRRPANADRLEFDGNRFIPENSRWDADELECVAKALGDLYEIAPEFVTASENEAWLKRRAQEFCLYGTLTLSE